MNIFLRATDIQYPAITHHCTSTGASFASRSSHCRHVDNLNGGILIFQLCEWALAAQCDTKIHNNVSGWTDTSIQRHKTYLPLENKENKLIISSSCPIS